MASSSSIRSESNSVPDTDEARPGRVRKRPQRLSTEGTAATARCRKKARTKKHQSASDQEYVDSEGHDRQQTNSPGGSKKVDDKGTRAQRKAAKAQMETRALQKATRGRNKTLSPLKTTIGISAADHGSLQIEAKKAFHNVRSWAENWSTSGGKDSDLTDSRKWEIIKMLSSSPKIASRKGAFAVLEHECGPAIVVEALLCHTLCKGVVMRPFRFFDGLSKKLPDVEEFLEELFDLTMKGAPQKASMWRSWLLKCFQDRETAVDGSKAEPCLQITQVCERERDKFIECAKGLLKQNEPKKISKRDNDLLRIFKQAAEFSIHIFSQGQVVKCLSWQNLHQKPYQGDGEELVAHPTMNMFNETRYDQELLQGCKVDFLVRPLLSMFGQDDGSGFGENGRPLLSSCVWFIQQPPTIAYEVANDTDKLISGATLAGAVDMSSCQKTKNPKHYESQALTTHTNCVEDPAGLCEDVNHAETRPINSPKERICESPECVELKIAAHSAQVAVKDAGSTARDTAEDLGQSSLEANQHYASQPVPDPAVMDDPSKIEDNSQKDAPYSRVTCWDSNTTERGTESDPILVNEDCCQQEHPTAEENVNSLAGKLEPVQAFLQDLEREAQKTDLLSCT